MKITFTRVTFGLYVN